MKKTIVFSAILFLVISTFFVLYPQPAKLAISIYRYINPPIDYSEIDYFLEAADGKDAAWIEDFVKKEIPYQHDWETYNYPWYFPNVKEVVDNRAGDCKSRMILTASILEYYNLSYELLSSPTHVWVNYNGKKENKKENEDIVLVSLTETSLSIPDIDWRHFFESFYNAAWVPMPQNKKMLLINIITVFFCIILIPTKE